MRLGRLVTVVALIAGVLAVIPAAQGSASADGSGLPTIRIGDSTVVEGDAGRSVVNVPVDLSAPSTVPVTVQYAIVGQTATAGSDFLARKGKMTFKAGSATKELSVVVLGDTLVEPNELVDIHLSSPVNATIDDADGSVTIDDDDSDSATGVQVSIGDVVVTANADGTHLAALPVTLSQPAPSTIKVYYELSCGINETSGFQMKQSGTLTFLAKQQSKSLTFHVPLDQSLDDALTFLDTISVAVGPAVVHQSQGQGLVLDGSGSGGGPPPVGSLDRVSVASDGTEAQFMSPEICSGYSVRGSLQAAISGDGRYVAFTSDATNLVPGDTNGLVDVFVHDRLTGATQRVSVRSDGSQVPPDNFNDMNTAYPSISADGRYVTFVSQRSLTSDDVNGQMLYLYDRSTGQTELVSKATDGTPAGNAEYGPISDDGRYVVFESDGTLGTDVVQPTADQSPSNDSVFLRDRVLGTTTLVSTSYNGQWTNSDSVAASISGDGRYISWTSDSPNIVPGDTNGCNDIFTRDMVTGVTERDDVTDAGDQMCVTGTGALSADGRYVAFSSAPTTWGQNQIFVHDRVLGTTELIGPDVPAMGTGEPDISGDGQFVSYRTLDPTTDTFALFVYDRATGATTTVGQLPDGTLPDGDVSDGFDWYRSGALSRDGSYIAFTSDSTNLVADDANDAKDVFEQRIN